MSIRDLAYKCIRIHLVMQLGIILRKCSICKGNLQATKSRFLFGTILYSLKDLNAITELTSVSF
jgi:hypothetical protein